MGGSIAETAPGLTRQHGNGEVYQAESIEAAKGVCPALARLSLEEIGLLFELEALGNKTLDKAAEIPVEQSPSLDQKRAEEPKPPERIDKREKVGVPKEHSSTHKVEAEDTEKKQVTTDLPSESTVAQVQSIRHTIENIFDAKPADEVPTSAKTISISAARSRELEAYSVHAAELLRPQERDKDLAEAVPNEFVQAAPERPQQSYDAVHESNSPEAKAHEAITDHTTNETPVQTIERAVQSAASIPTRTSVEEIAADVMADSENMELDYISYPEMESTESEWREEVPLEVDEDPLEEQRATALIDENPSAEYPLQTEEEIVFSISPIVLKGEDEDSPKQSESLAESSQESIAMLPTAELLPPSGLEKKEEIGDHLVHAVAELNPDDALVVHTLLNEAVMHIRHIAHAKELEPEAITQSEKETTVLLERVFKQVGISYKPDELEQFVHRLYMLPPEDLDIQEPLDEEGINYALSDYGTHEGLIYLKKATTSIKKLSAALHSALGKLSLLSHLFTEPEDTLARV